MSDAPDQEAKTEEPTHKRLRDALDKGKGAFSRELPVLASILAVAIALHMTMPRAAMDLALLLRHILDHAHAVDLSAAGDIAGVVRQIGYAAAVTVAPTIAVIAASGIAASMPQGRGVAIERLKVDPARLSPIAGWKRLFGRQGAQHAVRSFLKLVIVAVISGWSLMSLAPPLVEVSHADVEWQIAVLAAALGRLSFAVALAYVAVAILDVLHAWLSWRRDLRMTRQEVKDEMKEAEGNPAIRRHLRLLAMQRSRRRITAEVARATVVVANPTHFAVALRYDKSEGGAPRVVAKGRDRVALRIRHLAETHDVPVVENKALARALYDQVPVDSYIPPEFYRAVAQIIAFLASRNQRRSG